MGDDKNPALRKATVGLKRLTQDESYQMLRDEREKVLRDEDAKQQHAREEGIREGLLMAATAMLKENYPTSTIAKLLNLTQEEILKLQREISLSINPM